jgi:LysM repeat protein
VLFIAFLAIAVTFKEGAFRLRIPLISRPAASLSASFAAPRALALSLAVLAAALFPAFSHAQNSASKDSGSYGPIVAIVSPEYADVLKGEAKIVIAIKPRRYPAQGVELLVDGKAVTGVLPVQTKFTWKTSLFVDGPHTLGVRVTDTQGFIGQAETMVYINNARPADSTAPILRWLGVENGQKLSGRANIRLEASDNFGVKYVFLTLNSAITPDKKPVLASWMTNRPPYEFSIDTTRYKDGMYVLDALAFDAADNERNAPRLTVGFFNSAPEAPVAPETSAPSETPAPKNPDSGSAGESVAPSTSGSPRIAPPLTAQAAPPREVAPPQGTVTTTPNGWIATAPAPTDTQTAQSGEPRITTHALASRPPLPTRDTSQNETPTPAPAVQPQAVQPQAVQTQAAQPQKSQTPTVQVPVAPQVRISRTQVEKTAQAPSVTVSGQSNTTSAISSRTLNNQRLAVAPEIRWTTPGEFRSSAKTSANASTTFSSQAAPPAWSTPSLPAPDIAPLATETHTLQLTIPQTATPQVKSAMHSGAQLSQSTLAIGPNTRIAGIEPNRSREPLSVAAVIAALPTATAPTQIAATSEPSAVKTNTAKTNTVKTVAKTTARTTSIAQAPDTRRVFAAPLSTPRVAAAGSTPSLPTAPRLAFSPNLNKPSAPAPANAAIVVSPASDIPAVHIAQKDETLAAIAARYKMPVSAVAAANNVQANAKIARGAQVILPQALVVSYKGQAVTGDVAPLLIGSTSVAPFRFLFEKQGGTMDWDAASQRVTARNANYEVSLEIGSDKALVNQKEVMMDMAAFLLSGRTMVPVRFFEKALQAKVEWEPSTGRIFVAMTP